MARRLTSSWPWMIFHHANSVTCLLKHCLVLPRFAIFQWSCLCKFLDEYMFLASLSKHQGCPVVRAWVQLCEGAIETEAEEANGVPVPFNVAASFSCAQAMNENCQFFSLLIYLAGIWCCQSFGFWPFYQGVECLYFLRTNIDYKQQVPTPNRPDFTLVILPLNGGVIFSKLLFPFQSCMKKNEWPKQRGSIKDNLPFQQINLPHCWEKLGGPYCWPTFVQDWMDPSYIRQNSPEKSSWPGCSLFFLTLSLSSHFLEQRRKKMIDFYIIYLVS